MTTNDSIAKKFLTERNKSGMNATRTFRFENYEKTNLLFSYSTLIAKYDEDNNVLYIADKNFTNTTSKHRGAVIKEAQKLGIKILPVPIQMNGREFPTNKDILDRLEARMDKYSIGTELALADNRKEFLVNFYRYVEYVGILNTDKPKHYDRYVEISNMLTDTDYIKSLQKARREFLKNEQANFVTTLNTYYNS